MSSVAGKKKDKCDIETRAEAEREAARANAFRKVCFKETFVEISVRMFSYEIERISKKQRLELTRVRANTYSTRLLFLGTKIGIAYPN